MDSLALNEAKKFWKKATQYKQAPDLDIETELLVHKRILTLFHVGPYYYFIFNLTNSQVEYTSESIREVLGCEPEAFGPPFTLAHIHPEDLPYFINFEHTAVDFFGQLPPGQIRRYKVSYDYRIKRSDGQYIRLLHQLVTLQGDEEGSVLRSLGIHTDITSFKKEGKPMLSFIDLEGDDSFINVTPMELFAPVKPVLTHREKQVLRALMNGMASKQVAGYLSIAKETVDRHRKNMLAKTGTQSTPELISKAVNEGWL
ncbi:LuxR C-terminal-related transcriptional regulator [Siphonobacter sp.]|uniref:LuxR C-terminal-related transcriptional regulator n=1 Tax=Siphonobacter sp. TaxID=1869184 RepID=UPI003B3A907E